MQTVISAKGQIVIPKETKARQEWVPGTKLDIIEIEDGIILRKHKTGNRLSRLGGMLHDPTTPPLTTEQMSALIEEYDSGDLM